MMHFKRTTAVVPTHPPVHPVVTHAPEPFVERSRRGAVHDYSGEHMINNIRFALNQSNQRKVQATAEYGLRIFFPRDWRAQLANLRSAGGGKIPSKDDMIAGRKHLDIASMLLRRHWYKTKGPCFRFVGIDASPQRGGLEVMATAERVILQSDVRAARPGDPKPPVEIRRMPVSVLGHGRCGLADKVQTTVHQTWLDYGPFPQSDPGSQRRCPPDCI